MGSSRSQSRRNESNRSCCTWPRILLLVIILVVAGVCIWKFVPWEDTINEVLDNVPIPGGGGGGYDDNSSSNGGDNNSDEDNLVNNDRANPSGDDDNDTTQKYEFIQCDQNPSSTCCNGLSTICDLRADEILYATLHNGMSTLEDGFLFGPNHKFQLETALKAGYRGMNLDLCNCGGEIIFCHGICTLGPRDVIDVMNSVNTFLDNNPSEVVIFIYEVNNGVDRDVDLNLFYDKLLQVDGLVDKMYVHDDPTSPWPTLRELTDPSFNKRIIMFHYNGPNCNEGSTVCPDGLHLYYNYASDNDWSNDNVASIEDRTNSCQLKPNGIDRNVFVGLNNFVSPPSQNSAQILNKYSAASDYVSTCSNMIGTDINFLLVDYWSEGELPRVTQDHNEARALQRKRKSLLRL